MTPVVFGGGVALISAMVLATSVRAYVRLGAEAGAVPGRSMALDLLRVVPWGLGLIGGVGILVQQAWAPDVTEAAGWALAVVGVVQFALDLGSRLRLRRTMEPDDGPEVPLAEPVIGALIGLAVILLVALTLVLGARAV